MNSSFKWEDGEGAVLVLLKDNLQEEQVIPAGIPAALLKRPQILLVFVS